MRTFALFAALALLAACVSAQSSIPLQICGSSSETFIFNGAGTVSVTTDKSLVTVTPSVLSFTGGSASYTVDCGAVGPVEISFFSGNTLLESKKTLCRGLITVTNPVSEIVRGNDFVLDVTLTPTPTEVVQLIVSEDNPLIVPGTDRMTFAVGQSSASAKFFVPLAEVGPVNIQFRSTSLFDYAGASCGSVIIPVNVLGTISTSLAGATVGDGVRTTVEVTISPAAIGSVVVDIDTNGFGSAIPSQLVFNSGDSVKSFEYLPNAQGAPEDQTLTFTSASYAQLDEVFTVQGSIFTDIPPVVSTFATESLTVVILPAATADLDIVLTSSDNVNVPAIVTVPAGQSFARYELNALVEGDATVTFSAAGFAPFTENFVVADVSCPEGQTTNSDGDLCVTCPGSNGSVCSGSGTCTFSTLQFNLARCDCAAGFAGSECQFADGGEECFAFTSAGGSFNVDNIPAVSNLNVVVPANVIQDNNPVDGGDGTLCVEGYFADAPFGGAVDPVATAFTVTNKVVRALATGMDVDISVFDNTPAPGLNGPLSLTIAFDRTEITQEQFAQSALYYWNAAAGMWMPAMQTCPAAMRNAVVDLQALSASLNVCATGQYHLFEISPVPASEVPVDEPVVVNEPADNSAGNAGATTGTTGASGQQAPLPPQPNFGTVQHESSSASLLQMSFAAVVVIVASVCL